MDRKRTTPLTVTERTERSFGVCVFLLLLNQVSSAELPGPGGGVGEGFMSSGPSPPEIVAGGDIVLQPGDNATVDCIGNAPILWSWDIDTHSSQRRYPDNRVWNEDLVLTENGMYRRTLHFSDAQFFNSGLYFCDYSANETTNTTTTTPGPSSGGGFLMGGMFRPFGGGNPSDNRDKKKQLSGTSIKIFVSDPSHMFTVEVSDVPLMVPIFYGHRVTIPCRVSDPSFNVTLSHSYTKEDYTNRKDVTYDPMEGFVVDFPYFTFTGTFQCEARATGNATEDQEVQILNLVLLFRETQILPPPHLVPSSLRLQVGNKLTLTCKMKVKPNNHVELYMIYKQKDTPDESRVVLEVTVRERKKDRDHEFDEMTLVMEVLDVRKTDSGDYSCEVKGLDTCVQCNNNRQQASVTITVYEEEYILLKPLQARFEINSTVDGVYFYVAINSFPQPKLQWFHNGRLLHNSLLYQMKQVRRAASLYIVGPRASHSGVYTLFASTRSKNTSTNITLLVNGKPEVSILPVASQKGQVVVHANTNVQLYCQVEGMPASNVTWFFQEVPPGNFTQNSSLWREVDNDLWELTQRSRLQEDYVLRVTHTLTGWYRCAAVNNYGKAHDDIKYIVADESDKDGLAIKSNAPRDVVRGDHLRLVCRANLWMYTSLTIVPAPLPSLTPSRVFAPSNNDTVIVANRSSVGNGTATAYDVGYRIGTTEAPALPVNYQLLYSRTQYSLEVVAFFPRLAEEDEGVYVCQATDFNNNSVIKSFQLQLADIRSPVIREYSSGSRRISEFSGVTLKCIVVGYPPPKILWYKDNSTLNVTVPPDGSLTLENVTLRDAGNYRCAASNYGGRIISQNMTLYVGNPTQASFTSVHVGAISGVLIIILILVVIAVVIFCRKSASHKDLEKFLIQPIGDYNPDLPIDEQTGCLPYDPKWEFPKERLRMGMILGQGAFGRVMKAEAIGIGDSQTVTTVAVKMVKNCTDKDQMMALLSELKILIHLGQHLNIVNLLGAVTKDLRFGELNVIVEYCHYGNLRTYLLKHKDSFTDTMEDHDQPPTSPSPADKSAEAGSMEDSSSAPYRDPAASPRPASVSNRRDGAANSSGGDLGPALTTKNLICWCFQVARGMEYLHSKKYIHRDLAARNVLLAKDNVVKICDFGLAKDLYKDPEYHKKGDGPVPVKWMALESLTHRLCTTKSDVWSYGILVWELFSLGGNPYPGVEINEKFVAELKSGYRMDKPIYASEEMHKVILRTWNADPEKRPPFTELVSIMGDFLEANVKQYYLDLKLEGEEEDPALDEDGYLRHSISSDQHPLTSPTSPTLPPLQEEGGEGGGQWHYVNQRSIPHHSQKGSEMEMQPLLSTRGSPREKGDDCRVEEAVPLLRRSSVPEEEAPRVRPPGCPSPGKGAGGSGSRTDLNLDTANNQHRRSSVPEEMAPGFVKPEGSPTQVHTSAEVHRQPEDSDSGHSSSYAPGTSPTDNAGYLLPKALEAATGGDKDLRDSVFSPPPSTRGSDIHSPDYIFSNCFPPDYSLVVGEEGEQQELPV